MSYNVKELENLSKEEQIELLLKTLETAKCSNQDCTNDKPTGKWGVIEHKKYCNVCYSRELRKEEIRLKRRQEELHKLVEYYEYYLKVIDAIKNLKVELDVGEDEFKEITDPIKLAFKEAKKVQGNNEKRLNPNRDKQHQQQQNNSQQSRGGQLKEASTPDKQAKPYTQQTTDKSASEEVSETPTQKRKKETPPTINEELDKQKEIQKQSSSTDQVEEKTNLVKDPIPSPPKKQKVEEQNTNTQFVTQIDSKTVYGEHSTDPSSQGDSSVNDQSLFDLDPGTPENNEYNEFNQEYNSSSQDFQNIRQSSVNQADSKAGVTKEPINFTGFPGSQL